MNTMNTRAGSIGFYIFLITVILAPIAFWPSSFATLDAIKVFVIGVGVLLSALFLGYAALKEGSLTLPPKRILWASALLVASLIVSGLLSMHVGKSLFGQGFEITTASFIAVLFVAALASFTIALRRSDRAMMLYAGIFVAYFLVYLMQLGKLIFGAGFASFSVFPYITSNLLGGWFNVGYLSVVVLLVCLSAGYFLKLSNRMKAACWVMGVLAFVAAFIVNDFRSWFALALIALGLAISMSVVKIRKARLSGRPLGMRGLVWLPIVICVVSAALAFEGGAIAAPVVRATGTSYFETSLPWQLTMDVTNDVVKKFPVFGAGPNHFLEAYLQNKPDAVNVTDSWGVEFQYGFALIPTLIAEQGLVGLVLWLVFLVFLGLAGYRTFKNTQEDSSHMFMLASSYAVTTFLWIVSLISVPSQPVLLVMFIVTGIFFGTAVSSGALKGTHITSASQGTAKLFKIILVIGMILGLLWAVIYVKKLIALTYFGHGVKELTVANDFGIALADFTAAERLDGGDGYLRAKAEAEIAQASSIASKASSAASASSSQAMADQFSRILSLALLDAKAAIAYDPNNYYNYLSEARVSEFADSFKVQGAYDNAVQAYLKAIQANPRNPSIYLSLARLQASQNKLDDAMKSVGAALQVKGNYLDAIFLLSQIYVAQGDLNNAITASQATIKLNPNNPQLYFQLGLLEYNAKDFNGAIQAFGTAIKIQPDYANAQYFLGLSYAQLGQYKAAADQFSVLSKSNPDNQEVLNILKAVSAGRSPFAAPAAVSNPEKKASLPVKPKAKK